MMRRKTYLKKVLELKDDYQKGLEWQKKEFNRRISIEYDLAYSEMASKLRQLLVDVNYELFSSSDAFLRPKVYAFMANGLSMFHSKAYKGRPEKELVLMPESPEKEIKEN